MNSTRVFVARAGKVLVPRGLIVSRPARKVLAAARYRPSHRSLLVDVSVQDPTKTADALELGCVVLPIGRQFKEGLPGLELAAELAQEHDCFLVVICSKRARPADFPKEMAAALGDRLVLVNHAKVHIDWKPQLQSSRQRLGRFHRDNDAAEKRNLGLALASVIGWQSVLFMDDDISPASSGPTLNPASLGNALAALQGRPELRAVGWSAKDMDDHSVIGHSRELVRMKQELFVGAGALLVRCDDKTPYFPNIYNHDWIFLIALAKKARNPLQAIGYAGTVRQLTFNPFVPGRARSEEAGEVLGEGLMNLLEDHGADFEAYATIEFWEQALRLRRELVIRLQTMVARRARRQGAESFQRVRRALVAAEEVNRDLTAEDLARYVGIMRQDEESWEGHRAALGRAFISRPGARQVLTSLQSGKPPVADWRTVLLPCAPADASIKAATPDFDLKPNARPAESDAQAASGEGVPRMRDRLRWRKGFDVRPRRPISSSSAAPQLTSRAAASVSEREAAGLG